MTVGQLAVAVSQIVPILQKEGILDAKGDVISTDPSAFAKVAVDVEQIISQFVTIPAEVDKIVKALPLVLMLVGAK